jgi:NADH:ubiquinone oxidoreductase subunit 4 (subunit M)
VDLKPRELWAIAPIAVCCLAIGLYPKPFLDVIRPDVNAIVEVYEQGSRWEMGGRPAPILAEAR